MLAALCSWLLLWLLLFALCFGFLLCDLNTHDDDDDGGGGDDGDGDDDDEAMQGMEGAVDAQAEVQGGMEEVEHDI